MDETPKPKDGYIPRPPSPEDLKEVSEQQGMITDEWAPEPGPDALSPIEDAPGERDAEGQPG